MSDQLQSCQVREESSDRHTAVDAEGPREFNTTLVPWVGLFVPVPDTLLQLGEPLGRHCGNFPLISWEDKLSHQRGPLNNVRVGALVCEAMGCLERHACPVFSFHKRPEFRVWVTIHCHDTGMGQSEPVDVGEEGLVRHGLRAPAIVARLLRMGGPYWRGCLA
jgi:hypothetical protein